MARTAPTTVGGDGHGTVPGDATINGNGAGTPGALGTSNGIGPNGSGATIVTPPAPRRRPARDRNGQRVARHSPAVRRLRAAPQVEPAPESERFPLGTIGALGFVLLLALLVRVAAVWELSPQVDEPATILAARQVAARGLPILPSDTLYLHGATLSYLLAPLVWLGAGDLGDLRTLRLVSVAAGVAAVGLTYLLALRISGATWAGILAALLVAIDAGSVQWSAHVRMYALLQALTLVVVLLFLRLLARPAGPVFVAGLVAAFWLLIFTHVGAALLWPAVALVALVAFGRDLIQLRRDLLVALGLCLLAPLTLSTLNRLFQPRDYSDTTDVPFFSFAGEGLFNGERLREPSTNAWRTAFGDGYGREFLPYIVVATAGLLVGRYLLARGRRGAGDATTTERRLAVALLATTYAATVLVISFFTWEQMARYLVHVQPLGYVLVATGLALLVRGATVPDGAGLFASWRHWLPRTAAATAITLASLAILTDGLAARFADPFVDTDQITAVEYVAAHRQPGELVIASLPPAPYLALGGDEDLVFLAGSELTKRVQRYTRMAADGRTVDYWVGVDAITSTAELCRLLIARPDAWLILDEQRLRDDWAYGGEMEQTIRRMTELVAEAPGGVQIYRRLVPPPGATFAAPTCGGHATMPEEDATPPPRGPQRRDA